MRSVSERERNLMALRTEAIRQFRIANQKNAPEEVIDGFRQEIAKLEIELDKCETCGHVLRELRYGTLYCTVCHKRF